MTALLFKQLFEPAQLTNAAATYFTCPASVTTSLLNNGRIRFTNTDAASHQVTAYAVPVSGTAGAANCFMNAEAIAPNTHMDVDVPQLAAGDFLQAKADVGAVVTILALSGTVIA